MLFIYNDNKKMYNAHSQALSINQ